MTNYCVQLQEVKLVDYIQFDVYSKCKSSLLHIHVFNKESQGYNKFSIGVVSKIFTSLLSVFLTELGTMSIQAECLQISDAREKQDGVI